MTQRGRGDLPVGLRADYGVAGVEWRVAAGLVAYDTAVGLMDARAEAIALHRARELVWLLEHPPLYTAGTSAKPEHLIDGRFPVFPSSRGGQFTYHGPGQRVAYLMLDLRRRAVDIRRYVATLEAWIIRALAVLGVEGGRREDRVGVWVRRPDQGSGREDKIAAIGVRVRRFVTLHGISLNVDPQLEHFSGIVPCGVPSDRHGVTSLAGLGLEVTMQEVDDALRREFEPLFGPIELATLSAIELEHGGAFCGKPDGDLPQTMRSGIASGTAVADARPSPSQAVGSTEKRSPL